MREVINLTERYGPIDPEFKAECRRQSRLAEQLYDMRTERGLSLEEVAKLLRVRRSVIFSIEEADYDSAKGLQIIERLAAVLGYAEPPTRAPVAAAAAG